MKFKLKLFSPLQQDNYVFTVPPMNDGDDERGHQMRVQTSVMDRVVAGNLNATFREALRSFYTLDDLKAFAPKDKQEAKWLIHQVEHIKLFSIHLHNSWVKKHSTSGVYDRRLISQAGLPKTLLDLTQVYHSLKGEERFVVQTFVGL